VINKIFAMRLVKLKVKVEEQAKYDVEAPEKANDLVAGKEKEIQDLEVER
jgi:hypothetical protein